MQRRDASIFVFHGAPLDIGRDQPAGFHDTRKMPFRSISAILAAAQMSGNGILRAGLSDRLGCNASANHMAFPALRLHSYRFTPVLGLLASAGRIAGEIEVLVPISI